MTARRIQGEKQYSITREADIMATMISAGRRVSDLADDYQTAKLSEVVPQAQLKQLCLTNGLPQTNYLKLVQKVRQRMLEDVQRTYPHLEPSEKIIVTNFRTQLIPLLEVPDVEIFAGGSIVKYTL